MQRDQQATTTSNGMMLITELVGKLFQKNPFSQKIKMIKTEFTFRNIPVSVTDVLGRN